MKRKKFLQTLAGVVAAVVMATSIAPTGLAKANENSSLETSDVSALGDGAVAVADGGAAEDKLATPQRVSVHDPSIVKDNNTYYVFGSHLANAKSTDLINWEQMTGDYGSYDWKTKSIYGNILENLSESFKWAGYDDGDCANGGLAVWAPDVIWNADYVWEDGSTGAWMIYYSASSTWRRSCIGYAVSKNIEGPYSYVDTVIYSGFTKTGGTDGTSTRDTKWDNDYLNLKELINNYKVDPSCGNGISDISDNWFNSDGGWNNNYAPNAIDPTLFYGADNKLYMVYGSWSGGLFILEINKETGAVIYPGVDSVDEVSKNFTDRYFGTHIAGANHQSGEGPFIDYDAETGYYWLYETYGGLTATGGYNMRLFRSENVYGPYVDAAGNNAAGSGVDNDKYGVKLIGNYRFLNQPGYRAAGHNSALIDDDGSRYLVFHQRFDEPENQTERHEVRVHQQFLNEDRWPVTAVYENRGEKIGHYADDKVVGIYEIINHGTDSTGNMIKSQIITLNADGTVSGELEGTWAKTAGTDYDYVTITIGSDIYKGVFFEQQDETSEKNTVMTFTTIGNNNKSLWGSALVMTDKVKTQLAAAVLDDQMPSDANDDITLATEIKGATINWTSNKTNVVTNNGKVIRPEEDTDVTLTATIKAGQETLIKHYTVSIASQAKLIYGFDFEAEPVSGDAITIGAVKGSLNASPAALKGTAKIATDADRGQVLQITSAGAVEYNKNYLALPEDTLANVKTKGYTVAMWVNCGADIFEHSALFNAMRDGTYPMTRIGVNLCGRINANGYIDGGYYNTVLRGTGWHHVAYSIDATGLKTWVDGKLFEQVDKDLTSCFDESNNWSIQKASDVRVGSGSPWVDRDIENAMFDNVAIYDCSLIESEIKELYESAALPTKFETKQSADNPPTINPPISYPSEGSSSTDSPSAEKPAKDDKEPVKEETKTEVGTEVKVEEGKFEVVESKTDEPAVAFTAPASTKEKKVEIPDVVTVDGKEYKVTKIADGAYKKNSKITTVTIGENVTEIGKNAFSGCTNLKTVKINANVEKIGNGAFNGCKKMEKVSIPKNVQEIGAKAFNGCKNLKTITIKSTALKKVDATAFKGIKANATIKVPKKQYKAYKKMLKKVLPSTVKIVKY
ncbi:MAG: leucine-rich repeat protein [Lachnospiraceae bacterium]|nr:leucine-rich repeat protein [bacterium]MDY5516342.1 leucine-rich repeat protein [Lachnospiraceae bacterium]